MIVVLALLCPVQARRSRSQAKVGFRRRPHLDDRGGTMSPGWVIWAGGRWRLTSDSSASPWSSEKRWGVGTLDFAGSDGAVLDRRVIAVTDAADRRNPRRFLRIRFDQDT